MTVTAKQGITFSAEETDLVYQTTRFYIDELEQHLTWLRDQGGMVLPGAQIAVDEVRHEISRFQKMRLRIYQECYAPE